jgi:hypothetical protein
MPDAYHEVISVSDRFSLASRSCPVPRPKYVLPFLRFTFIIHADTILCLNVSLFPLNTSRSLLFTTFRNLAI